MYSLLYQLLLAVPLSPVIASLWAVKLEASSSRNVHGGPGCSTSPYSPAWWEDTWGHTGHLIFCFHYGTWPSSLDGLFPHGWDGNRVTWKLLEGSVRGSVQTSWWGLHLSNPLLCLPTAARRWEPDWKRGVPAQPVRHDCRITYSFLNTTISGAAFLILF